MGDIFKANPSILVFLSLHLHIPCIRRAEGYFLCFPHVENSTKWEKKRKEKHCWKMQWNYLLWRVHRKFGVGKGCWSLFALWHHNLFVPFSATGIATGDRMLTFKTSNWHLQFLTTIFAMYVQMNPHSQIQSHSITSLYISFGVLQVRIFQNKKLHWQMQPLYKYEVNTVFPRIDTPCTDKHPPQISTHHQGHDIK